MADATTSHHEQGESSQPALGARGMQHVPPSRGPADQQRERVPFTAEELQAIKECQSESFWYRCVPLTVVFVSATQYAIRAGYLQSKGRFGGVGRNVAAISAGFILGKLSYQGECRRKLMALPNSRLAEAMKNKGKAPELFVDTTGVDALSSRDSDAQSLQTDYNPRFDLDPERRVQHELDDSHRPNLDNSALPSDKHDPEGKPVTSYDDLRKQNRDNHDKRVIDSLLRRSAPSSSVPPDELPLQQQPPPPPPPSSSSSYQSSVLSQPEMRDIPDQPSRQAGQQQPRKLRNKYGDIIE